MKTFDQFIIETMTSAGGGVAGMHQNVVPTDGLPQIGGREADRLAIKPRKKQQREQFAGSDIFILSSEEYEKCLHGRAKFERWNKKLNMEDLGNQEMRSYAHANPGKPIVVQDAKTGVMSYLIPPTTSGE